MSNVNQHVQIVASSTMDTDRLVPDLLKLLEYRKMLAKELLRADGQRFNGLKDQYNYINGQITTYLGLKSL